MTDSVFCCSLRLSCLVQSFHRAEEREIILSNLLCALIGPLQRTRIQQILTEAFNQFCQWNSLEQWFSSLEQRKLHQNHQRLVKTDSWTPSPEWLTQEAWSGTGNVFRTSSQLLLLLTMGNFMLRTLFHHLRHSFSLWLLLLSSLGCICLMAHAVVPTPAPPLPPNTSFSSCRECWTPAPATASENHMLRDHLHGPWASQTQWTHRQSSKVGTEEGKLCCLLGFWLVTTVTLPSPPRESGGHPGCSSVSKRISTYLLCRRKPSAQV